MKKILVTGGTGYLGRHLVDSLLEDGALVRALVYSEWKGQELEDRGVEVIYGDVTEPETLVGITDGVDIVFHLVGGGGDGRRDPYMINTQATDHMVDACQAAGLKAFIYVSSSSVYGRQPDPVDEDSPPMPTFDYPQSKLDAERILQEKARETGFPAVIDRK